MAAGRTLFSLDPIKLKRKRVVHAAQVIQALKDAVQETLDVAELGYLKTTATWNNKPVFAQDKPKGHGDQLSGKIFTDSNVYNYLDDGTSIRHAVMHRPFRPKTTPGSLTSGSGQRTYRRGRYYFVSGRRSMPGIVKRDFTINIVAILDRTHVLQQAVDRRLKRLDVI